MYYWRDKGFALANIQFVDFPEGKSIQIVEEVEIQFLFFQVSKHTISLTWVHLQLELGVRQFLHVATMWHCENVYYSFCDKTSQIESFNTIFSVNVIVDNFTVQIA